MFNLMCLCLLLVSVGQNGYDATYMRWAGTDDMFAEWTQQHAFEFVWEPSSATTGLASNKSRGADNRILTHIMMHNYGDLAGLSNGTLRFTWEGDPFPLYELAALKDDEDDYSRYLGFSPREKTHPLEASPAGDAVDPSNVDAYADMLLAFVEERRECFQGPILAVWGSDYKFTQAPYMYGNMTKIMDHINQNPVCVSKSSLCLWQLQFFNADGFGTRFCHHCLFAVRSHCKPLLRFV